MGSVFEDACAAASAAVDTVYSESWIYQPYAATGGDVNGRPAADPNRAETPIIGVYINPYARAFSAEARHQGVKPEKPGHASSRPQIDLDVSQLPYPVCDGDRITRCKTGEVFSVAEPKFPPAGPRWQLDLNKLS